MSPTDRANVLRERFKTLFPTSKTRDWASSKPRKFRVKKKERSGPYVPTGVPSWFGGAVDPSKASKRPIEWVHEEPKPVRATVSPKRGRKGPLPLTTLSELLQPGSIHLAMRR